MRLCLYVLCSYTSRFDKVKLDKIVENVSELPDPEVNSKSISFSKRNSLHFLFYLFSDLYGLLFWSKCYFKHSIFWLLLYCSLMQLLKKLLMWRITTYMHFILLKNQLKKVLKPWRYVNTKDLFLLYCILCWYKAQNISKYFRVLDANVWLEALVL